MLDSARGFGELDVDMEADPTAQWRDGAQEAGVPDDEEVCGILDLLVL
jgi:hypothetical protein